MVADDEDSLICDLAETYGIFNYKELSPLTVATLSTGLGVNSRISKHITGLPNDIDTILLAEIADRLGMVLQCVGGIEKPKSIVSSLYGEKDEKGNVMSFGDSDEFMRYRYERN